MYVCMFVLVTVCLHSIIRNWTANPRPCVVPECMLGKHTVAGLSSRKVISESLKIGRIFIAVKSFLCCC